MIPAFVEAGADLVTVHVEACRHLHRVVTMVKELGCQVGVSLNPATSEQLLEPILPELDLVLVMSVNPGFGGQRFIPGVLPKIKRVKAMIEHHRPACYLEVDGGINAQTGQDVVKAGCNVLVAGSYVFNHNSVAEAINSLKLLRACPKGLLVLTSSILKNNTCNFLRGWVKFPIGGKAREPQGMIR